MFNIEKFIQIRKSKNLSQTQLCKGICTQATLSKFENEGQPPSFKIMEKLCIRLGILTGDIMLRSDETPASIKLQKAAIACIQANFTRAYDLISSIKEEDLLRVDDQALFHLVVGIYALFYNRDQVKALFNFNTILTNPLIEEDNIYYALATTACGLVYEERHDYEKAEENYSQIQKLLVNIKVTNKMSLFQVLWMLYQTGEYYGKRNNIKESNYLLRYAYQIASQYNGTFFMSRILYRLGMNMVGHGKNHQAIQYLRDAHAFARFSHNQYILTKARQELNKLER